MSAASMAIKDQPKSGVSRLTGDEKSPAAKPRHYRDGCTVIESDKVQVAVAVEIVQGNLSGISRQTSLAAACRNYRRRRLALYKGLDVRRVPE